MQAWAGACALALCLSAGARAQDNGFATDLLPAQGAPGIEAGTGAAPSADNTDLPGAPTHPPLRLTPDKSEILALDRPAQSLIIGNPAHLNILMDSTTRLILVPREPGATFFTILDENGRVVMQRHAIVAAPAEKYIRVRRSCSFSGENCTGTSVYYCPDMCHPVGIMGQDSGDNAAAGSAAGPTPGVPSAGGGALPTDADGTNAAPTGY